MRTEKLDAELKTRVAKPVKEGIEEIAGARHLKPADIVREALREYLAKHQIASSPGALGETASKAA